jgi:hypothetical protein
LVIYTGGERCGWRERERWKTIRGDDDVERRGVLDWNGKEGR